MRTFSLPKYEGKDPEITRATKALFDVINLHPTGSLAINLQLAAAECINQSMKQEQNFSQQETVSVNDNYQNLINACTIFEEKAKEIITKYLRKQKLNPALDDLSGYYMDADYTQIFATFLGEHSDSKKHKFGNILQNHTNFQYQKEFEMFRNSTAKLEPGISSGLPGYKGWHNFATWKASSLLDLDKQARIQSLSAVWNCVTESRNRQRQDSTGSFIRRCIAYYKDIIRGLALENFLDAKSQPSELFGRFKNVDVAEVAISRIEELNIRKIVLTTPANMEIVFFAGPDTDVAKAIAEKYPVDDKIIEFRNADNGRIVWKNTNMRVVSFKCSDLDIRKIEVEFDSGQKGHVFCNFDDDPEKAIKEEFFGTKSAKKTESDGQSGVFFNAAGQQILRWRILPRHIDEPSPSMTM